MIEVELNDGTIVEFPDGTSQETMSRALEQFRTETTWGEFAKGASLDLASGMMGATKTIPDALSFVLPDAWTNPWSEFFERGQDSARALQPAAYKKEKENKIVGRNAEGELEFNMPTAEQILGVTLESAPLVPFFAGGAPGLAGAARGAKLITSAGEKIAPLAKAGGELDALAFGIINAGVVAPDQWRETYKRALAGDPTRGVAPMSEEDAREAANKATVATAALSMTTGAAGGGIAEKLGSQSANMILAAAKGFMGEAPFEGIEESGQYLIGESALGLTPDPVEAANVGMVAGLGGGTPGAGVAAASHLGGTSLQQKRQADRDMLNLRDEYFDALDQARRTAEEIEGGQEPPTAANSSPPPPPPSPTAVPEPENEYDAALNELDKVAQGQAEADEGPNPTRSTLEGIWKAQELIKERGVGAQRQAESLYAGALESDPVMAEAFWDTWNKAQEEEVARRQAAEKAEQAATPVTPVTPVTPETTQVAQGVDVGQTGLNQPQQSVGEPYRPTPELEPIPAEGAAERAEASAQPDTEQEFVPEPQPRKLTTSKKKPPDLLEELSAGGVRLDASKFGGDIIDGANNVRVGNKWLFEGKELRKDGKGMGPEELVEYMVENGYMPKPDPSKPTQYGVNDAIEILNNALRGERIVSGHNDQAEAEYQHEQRWLQEEMLAQEEALDISRQQDEAMWALHLADEQLNSEEELDQWVEDTYEAQQETTEGDRAGEPAAEGQLIPEATAGERLAAEQKRRDAERNGLGRDEVTPDQGEGELLAGNEAGARPEQTDIEGEIEAKKRVVSQEAYDKAQAELKSAATRLNSGIDPTILKNLAIVAAYHIENVGRDFAAWQSEMRKRYGNRFDDMLEQAWGQALDTKGMPTQEEAPPAAAKAPSSTPSKPAQAKAAPEGFDPSQETGTAHAVTETERKLRGKSEVLKEAREKNAEVLDRAQEAMDADATLAPSLVNELLNDPDPSISKFKEAVLLIYKVDLQNRLRQLADRAAKAGSQEGAAIYQDQYQQIQLEMDMLDRATYESGSIWGDFGQFRGRLWANDYSWESRRALAEAKLGRPLTAQESNKIKEMAAKIEELQAQLEGRNEAYADKVDKFYSEEHYKRLSAMYDRKGKRTAWRARPPGEIQSDMRAAVRRFREQSRNC